MNENYMIVSTDKANKFRCPLPFTDYDGSVRAFCDGNACMAWINEIDQNSAPTGRGRCGMVSAILPLYTCAMPFEPETTPEE